MALRSRTWFREELDFPGPKTVNSAANWIQSNADFHDRFLLYVDEFDPHEPFDSPTPWMDRYDPHWEGPRIIWPGYGVRNVERGVLTEREGQHIRCNYGSKLSMIDHWFGKVLDALDAQQMWDDTMVILCTDHGHYLGEKDIWGKLLVPQYETLGHTPLYISYPGVERSEVNTLTTNVDINATLCDLFDVTPDHITHGESLLPLLSGETDSIREYAIGGVFGNWVMLYDGKRKYARAPVDNPFPLSMWSNRRSTMLYAQMHRLWPMPDKRAKLDFMPGSDIPVFRQPFAEGDVLPYWCARARVDEHHLYNVDLDPSEDENRLGGQDETDMIELLRVALKSVDAPAEQFERLGIT